MNVNFPNWRASRLGSLVEGLIKAAFGTWPCCPDCGQELSIAGDATDDGWEDGCVVVEICPNCGATVRARLFTPWDLFP